ncbi:egg cell-secreted protein 1.3-like [Prunus yedoensis var. nudiflora]|uniref:Egg cell-secreted protein 1.3-like n=1 Tax=Prunus yedoensis var. nudiflora TaxID=2094558 RepID=A0A314Z9E8_PRUYE|nr:egg cell-secreted protein 1.3-like [Prunus yedoensis var. nudiflora]
MAFKNAAFLLLMTTMCLIMSANNAIANARNMAAVGIKTGSGGQGGLGECWNALVELKSCSNEVVLFFLNGQADIGTDCCKAIATITHHCWPAMLTSLGFTAEEGNILRGYCDAASAAGSTDNASSSSAPASPPLAAASSAATPAI